MARIWDGPGASRPTQRPAPHGTIQHRRLIATGSTMTNSFKTRTTLTVDGQSYEIYKLDALRRAGLDVDATAVLAQDPAREPAAARGRHHGHGRRHQGAGRAGTRRPSPTREIAFRPSRVLLQDFTGVPGDRRPGRDARRDEAAGRRPQEDQPAPAGRAGHRPLGAGRRGRARRARSPTNAELEFQRNRERYAFLRWGQNAFENFRVVPPDTGIVHQVNLEYLARVVFTATETATAGDRRWPIPTRWSAPTRTRR